MKTIYNETIYNVDVDGTLISLRKFPKGTYGTVPIYNPYVGEYRYVKIHHSHIALVREFLGRGRYLIVWSGSGVKWCRAVLKAVGLKHKNIMTMTKPIGYLDDLECSHWLQNRIFLNEPGLENE